MSELARAVRQRIELDLLTKVACNYLAVGDLWAQDVFPARVCNRHHDAMVRDERVPIPERKK